MHAEHVIECNNSAKLGIGAGDKAIVLNMLYESRYDGFLILLAPCSANYNKKEMLMHSGICEASSWCHNSYMQEYALTRKNWTWAGFLIGLHFLFAWSEIQGVPEDHIRVMLDSGAWNSIGSYLSNDKHFFSNLFIKIICVYRAWVWQKLHVL